MQQVGVGEWEWKGGVGPIADRGARDWGFMVWGDDMVIDDADVIA